MIVIDNYSTMAYAILGAEIHERRCPNAGRAVVGEDGVEVETHAIKLSLAALALRFDIFELFFRTSCTNCGFSLLSNAKMHWDHTQGIFEGSEPSQL